MNIHDFILNPQASPWWKRSHSVIGTIRLTYFNCRTMVSLTGHQLVGAHLHLILIQILLVVGKNAFHQDHDR